jgi:D-xylose transport system ATP-binding protein
MTSSSLSERTASEPLLRLIQISKQFGALIALHDVSLQVLPGGGRTGWPPRPAKSRCLLIAGLHQPTTGTLIFNGTTVCLSNPAQAQALGISMAYQTPLLAENLDVIDNVSLGREVSRPRVGGLPDDVHMARRALELLREFDAANIVHFRSAIFRTSSGTSSPSRVPYTRLRVCCCLMMRWRCGHDRQARMLDRIRQLAQSECGRSHRQR